VDTYIGPKRDSLELVKKEPRLFEASQWILQLNAISFWAVILSNGIHVSRALLKLGEFLRTEGRDGNVGQAMLTMKTVGGRWIPSSFP
jgi:hypothetical protein